MIHSFCGTHIICDSYEVSPKLFKDINRIKETIKNGVKKSGATLIDFICYEFINGGFTLLALLKESHVSIHAYPENQSLFIDVFTCGDINALVIIEEITKYFMPQKSNIKVIDRGSKDNSF